MKTKLDYTELIKFIKKTNELRNASGLARFLGVSRQNINSKLMGKSYFTVEQIMLLKKTFKLSSYRINKFFFTEVQQDEKH